jgi:hypothetical protein
MIAKGTIIMRASLSTIPGAKCGSMRIRVLVGLLLSLVAHAQELISCSDDNIILIAPSLSILLEYLRRLLLASYSISNAYIISSDDNR